MLIAQFSDVHVGGGRYREELLRAAGRLRACCSSTPAPSPTLRTRGFPNPAYNLIRVEAGRISVDLCVPRGERQSLGDYPRDWPLELSARHADPFVRAQRGVSLAEDETTTPRA